MAEEKKKYNKTTDFVTTVGIIAVVFLLNYVLSFSFGRFDLTEDQRHSLSENTIDMLSDEDRINDRIFFKIYLDGELPADLVKIKNAVKDMLDEFIVYAGDNIQYEFIDPNGSEDEDYNLEMQNVLAQQGLEWSELDLVKGSERKQEIIWPGAVIESGGTTMGTVQFFRGGRINNEQYLRDISERTINRLEYQLVSAIRKITDENKETVSFLHGHGELHEHQTMDIRKDLKEHFFIDEVNIDGQIGALDKSDVLIIAQPKTRFSEKDKFVIDQYIMQGGKVMWFVDPVSVQRDSLYITGGTVGLANNLNIEKDMLYKYGVRLNPDIIVDEDCGPLFIPQSQEIVDWYFYPLLETTDHPITNNIEQIRSQYASTMEIVNASDKAVTKTVILKSSPHSLIYKAPARINYGITMPEAKPNFYNGTQGEFPTAILLEGQFSSAFANRGISETFLNSPDFETKFVSDSTKMLVVSDGDIIQNEILDSMFTGEKWIYQFMPISNDIYGVKKPDGSPKYSYGNKDFVLNAVDYMVEDYSLMDIRTKTLTLRNLDESKVVADKEYWKFLNIAFPLIMVGLLALVQILLRRRKYARSV
jgi:ABC-2 type transport system permease protein